MVARRASKFPKRKFNETWIVVVRVKAKSVRNGKKKIDAKFYRAFSKEKRSGPRLPYLLGTKMLDRKTIAKSQSNFDHRMPITLTSPNTGSETGRAVAARLRVKRLVAWRLVRL